MQLTPLELKVLMHKAYNTGADDYRDYIASGDSPTFEAFWNGIQNELPEPEPYAKVTCLVSCGSVALDEAEYRRQMLNREVEWECPRCRNFADFDHDYWEATRGDE